MKASLTTKLGFVLGEGTARAVKRAFGYETVEELLRHYPRKIVPNGQLTELAHLAVDDHVTVLARIISFRHHKFGPGGRKMRTEVIISDGADELQLTIFNKPWLFSKIQGGELGLFAGTVSSYRGQLQLTQPDMQLIHDEEQAESSRMLRAFLPIYPATTRLSSWKIAECIDLALDALGDITDPIDTRVRADYVDLQDAFVQLHRPNSVEEFRSAMERFIFEEAFVLQAALAQRQITSERDPATPRPVVADQLRERFLRDLPFRLTQGQENVRAVIEGDLAQTHPMHRLLQGEVGSGKTVLALSAMLQVVDCGGQAALLAPTEVLAHQHFRSFSASVGDLVQIDLLTGSLGAAQKRAVKERIANGQTNIVVGTHALIQEDVEFADLGLVVIDEQHRFGVEQRAALTMKSATRPHVLVMTATPIPRTVALTAFGDLDTSELRELPAGRQEIQTVLVSLMKEPGWFSRIWERAREEVQAGSQVYVLCSRIGEGDDEGETQSVVSTYERLISGPLRGIDVAMLHGQLDAKEKDRVMADFAANRVSVLVATTVIEVGIDVPNSTLMVILDADRFGLAQLHQLRGRVGRGTKPGLCLLVTNAEPDSEAIERLSILTSSNDGFEIARKDLTYRREGDVLGTHQSGVRSNLRLLSVVDHESVIIQAHELAEQLVRSDPDLVAHPELARLIRDLNEAERYLEKT